jgi:hypothetical protein
MSLTEIPAPEDIRPMLRSYESMGGVLDFVFFDLPPSDEAEYDIHRSAAISTLEAIRRRIPLFQFSIRPEGAVGQPVSVEKFLGPHYDQRKGTYKLYGARSKSGGADYTTEGYTDAFFDPPHGLGAKRRGMMPLREFYGSSSKPAYRDDRDLFRDMNVALFNNFADLTVYSWSTDWSTYFDQGKEWWGAHLWTVANPARNLLIGLGASSTD